MSGAAIYWGQPTPSLAHFAYADITQLTPIPYLSSSVACDSTPVTGTNCDNRMTISEGSEFQYNTLRGYGGGVYSVSELTPWRHDLHISRTLFQSNVAEVGGGAVMAVGSAPNTLSVTHSELKSNSVYSSSSYSGGAIVYDMTSPHPGCPLTLGPDCTSPPYADGSLFGWGNAWTRFEFKSSTCTVTLRSLCRAPPHSHFGCATGKHGW